MVQTGQITFYDHFYSPFSHRVHIALKEAKAEFTHYTVNIMNKPDWFADRVNPAGKIPALTYGGPPAAPEEPSPESVKLAESLILVEFIADLFPEANLLPADPVQRARVRFFINIFETKVFPGMVDLVYKGLASSALLEGIEALQDLLPETGFAVGEWSIADVAVTPVLARLVMLLENELGKYPFGEGKKTLEVVGQPKFARFRKYLNDIKERPSFKATWDEPSVLAVWKLNPVIQR